MTRRSGLKIQRFRRRSVWHNETKNFSYVKIMFGMFLIGTIILIKKENGEFSFFLYSGELFMFDGDGNEFSSFREAFTQLENHFKSFLIENREKIMRKLQRKEDECFKQLNNGS